MKLSARILLTTEGIPKRQSCILNDTAHIKFYSKVFSESFSNLATIISPEKKVIKSPPAPLAMRDRPTKELANRYKLGFLAIFVESGVGLR